MFCLFLSVTLGYPLHDVLQWSAAEVLFYQCYYRIAPWGPERDDLRNALSMAMTANMHRNKDSKAFEPSDFMPFSEKPEKDDGDMSGLKEVFKGFSRKKK